MKENEGTIFFIAIPMQKKHLYQVGKPFLKSFSLSSYFFFSLQIWVSFSDERLNRAQRCCFLASWRIWCHRLGWERYFSCSPPTHCHSVSRLHPIRLYFAGYPERHPLLLRSARKDYILSLCVDVSTDIQFLMVCLSCRSYFFEKMEILAFCLQKISDPKNIIGKYVCMCVSPLRSGIVWERKRNKCVYRFLQAYHVFSAFGFWWTPLTSRNLPNLMLFGRFYVLPSQITLLSRILLRLPLLRLPPLHLCAIPFPPNHRLLLVAVQLLCPLKVYPQLFLRSGRLFPKGFLTIPHSLLRNFFKNVCLVFLRYFHQIIKQSLET